MFDPIQASCTRHHRKSVGFVSISGSFGQHERDLHNTVRAFVWFNSKGKWHNTNSQESHLKPSHDLYISASSSAIYRPLNLVSKEMSGCLTDLLSWIKAEVISPSHKASKHLSVQERRKNEDSLQQIGSKIEAQMDAALKTGQRKWKWDKGSTDVI